MKAAVLTGLRRIEIADVPKPVIANANDVLLKIAVVGVCGSDVHYYLRGKIGSQVVSYPFIVGHECSAIVEEVGKKVKKVKPGDEVVVEPAVSCHKSAAADLCRQCKMGRENTCEKLKFLGTPGQLPGCLCEYIVMPEDCCLATRGRITLEEGALCEPLAIGVYTIKQARVSKSDKVAILGAGPIGLSCLAAARHNGVREIYMTDRIDYRVEFAKKTGAKWAGREIGEQGSRGTGEMDVVCECAGQQETVDEAIEILRPGGKLMIVGIPPFERFSFAADKIRRKEITIYNVRRQNRCTAEAMKLVAQKRLKIDSFVTHRFKLEQTNEAIEMVADYRDGVIKAMVEL
ncbi:MAG: alcohol dehydrogenase catalytic domain-containing protein [Sedimentisphaerales bacterium]|jgi:L-iditol 2-dehydrogenase